MANILEFVREVLTNEGEQKLFLGEPHGYLNVHDFGDLSGEDVAEAVAALRATLPEDVAGRLAAYEGQGDELPPVRPLVGESDLDAAVRQLMHAAMLTHAANGNGSTATVDDQPAPAEDASIGGDAFEAFAPVTTFEPPTETPDMSGTFDAPVAEPTPVTEHTLKDESEMAVDEDIMADLQDVASGDVDSDDPYEAFGNELAEIVRFATKKMESVLRQAELRAADLVREAEEQAATTRREANEEAAAARAAASDEVTHIRTSAAEEAESILQAAKTAREEARVFKQTTTDEATALLESARTSHDEAQRHAIEVATNAEREAAAMLADARARRDEMKDAERELRKRLAGVEDVFRSLQSGGTDEEHPGHGADTDFH
jgi:hypothetical protein